MGRMDYAKALSGICLRAAQLPTSAPVEMPAERRSGEPAWHKLSADGLHGIPEAGASARRPSPSMPLARVMLRVLPGDIGADGPRGVRTRPRGTVVIDQPHEEEAMKRVIRGAVSAGLLLPWAVILAWLYSLTTSW